MVTHQQHNELNASTYSIHWKEDLVSETDSSYDHATDCGENDLEDKEASTIAEWGQTHDPESLSHPVLLLLHHLLNEEGGSDRHH